MTDDVTENKAGELTIDIEELRKRSLFIGTPMYGGMCHGMYTKSVADLSILCTQYQIPLRLFYLFNESLITRARNYIADEFVRSEFTHLMFIDSDIGFDARDVLSLLAISEPDSDKEIVCGPYPKKTIAWEKIKMAVDKGFADQNPDALNQFVGDYVFNPVAGTGSIRLDRPVEVQEGGTGFMMIQQSVFDKYKKAYPEFMYLPDHVRTDQFDGTREIMAYFDCVIEPVSRRYLSEDYMFCQWSRNAGLKVWMCPWMELQHVGTYTFGGSLKALAAIGATATADVSQLKKNPLKKK